MKKYWYKGRAFFLAGLLLALFVFGAILFQRAGLWLVANDQPQKADAIIVLMGSAGERILIASDLYFAGYSAKVIMVADDAPGKMELLARGIFLQNDAERSRSIALALGIPDSAIFIIPASNSSTINEARIIRDYLNHCPGIHSIILVSSSFHLRRAGLIFNDALLQCNHQVNLFRVSSGLDRFHAIGWWRDRESAAVVLVEYIKLLQYLFWEKWNL